MSYSYLHLSSHASYYLDFLTSFDGGYIHQGCWSWGGDVAGTAVSRTQVAVQSQGPHYNYFVIFFNHVQYTVKYR